MVTLQIDSSFVAGTSLPALFSFHVSIWNKYLAKAGNCPVIQVSLDHVPQDSCTFSAMALADA